MVSLNAYLRIRRAMELLGIHTNKPEDAEYAWQFLHPYVCVIHEPTGRGYYLDRSYQFILSVDSIPRPGQPSHEIPVECTKIIAHETQTQHRPACFSEPEWAGALPLSDFTTYWLY